MRKLKRGVARTPNVTSKKFFEAAEVKNVCRQTLCKILNNISTIQLPVKTPPLTQNHKDMRKIWLEQYIKTDFPSVIFTIDV